MCSNYNLCHYRLALSKIVAAQKRSRAKPPNPALLCSVRPCPLNKNATSRRETAWRGIGGNTPTETLLGNSMSPKLNKQMEMLNKQVEMWLKGDRAIYHSGCPTRMLELMQSGQHRPCHGGAQRALCSQQQISVTIQRDWI